MSDNSKPTQNPVLRFELTDIHQPRNTAITDAIGDQP